MFNTLNYLIRNELSASKFGRSEFLTNRFNYASNLYHKDLKGHFSCVNAIEFSNLDSNHLISAGDDKRILLWSVNEDLFSEKQNPIVMRGQHNSNVFALAWDNENQKIFSGANDHQVIVHDVQTKQVCDVFLHEKPVLAISVNPKQSHIFATACESGQICLYDLRLSNTEPIILASSSIRQVRHSRSLPNYGSYHSCCFNPVESNLIAVGNEVSGIELLDIRMRGGSASVLRYRASSVKEVTGSVDEEDMDATRRLNEEFNQNVMCVQFNRSGTRLAALRYNLKPVIYNVNDPNPKVLFNHENYKNACTMKSCCFAGSQDEYFVTG